jgi:hypothetical protein
MTEPVNFELVGPIMMGNSILKISAGGKAAKVCLVESLTQIFLLLSGPFWAVLFPFSPSRLPAADSSFLSLHHPCICFPFFSAQRHVYLTPDLHYVRWDPSRKTDDKDFGASNPSSLGKEERQTTSVCAFGIRTVQHYLFP